MPEKKRLDQVRDMARLRHLSLRTEETYCLWVKQFILFHGKRHPSDLGADEIRGFLVRNGKGEKDRQTMLPKMLKTALEAQLDAVKQLRGTSHVVPYAT